jgi:hypothetical protein
MTMGNSDDEKRIKLVDAPDTRNWLERMSISPERMERGKRIGQLMKQVRDAVVALDKDELAEAAEYMDLSAPEIAEVCNALIRNTREVRYDNLQTIKYLRSLTPQRIWGIRK